MGDFESASRSQWSDGAAEWASEAERNPLLSLVFDAIMAAPREHALVALAA